MDRNYAEGGPLSGSLSTCIHWLEQINPIHTDGLRKFIEGDDGWVASTVFETAKVLLAKARPLLAPD